MTQHWSDHLNKLRREALASEVDAVPRRLITD